MKLIQTNPNWSLGRVSDFDDWFRNPLAGFNALSRFIDWDGLPEGGHHTGRLATDVHEDKDNYYARFEVPGVKKEDVKIELNDRMLTVSVEKSETGDEGESSFSYTRSISVPDSVKVDGIGAKLEDGILMVTLPKSEERKTKNITVS